MSTNMKALVTLFSMILFFPLNLIVEAQPKAFNYMIFSQTWPPAFCNFAKCSSPIIHDNFTIHGLWDSYIPWISSPGPCSNTPFDPKLVAPIKSQLDKSWPNLKNQNQNTIIWAHEWTKHGTCLASVLDQTAYFTRSLHWKNEFDILAIMKKSGLNPGGSYQENAIKTAIESQVKSDNSTRVCKQDA
ncbi:ribonuclease 1-like [Silene latifolia]|uniref:ribonuclease 1-like n=1 Tax=Silene latifolia TaxID=37657 RepID=UPI003D772692